MTGLSLGLDMSLVNNFGGVALLNPDDIPDLVADFDAGDPSTIIEETGVSSWASKKGSSVITQTAASQQPAYDGAKVTFDGTDDVLFEATPSDILDGEAAYTMIFLFQRLVVKLNTMVSFISGSVARGNTTQLNTSEALAFSHRVPFGFSGGDTPFTPTLTGLGSPVTAVASRDNTTTKIRVEEDQTTSISSTDTAFTPAGLKLSLGDNVAVNGAPQTPFNGHLFRVLIYARVLNEDEIQQIFTLFNSLK